MYTEQQILARTAEVIKSYSTAIDAAKTVSDLKAPLNNFMSDCIRESLTNHNKINGLIHNDNIDTICIILLSIGLLVACTSIFSVEKEVNNERAFQALLVSKILKMDAESKKKKHFWERDNNEN